MRWVMAGILLAGGWLRAERLPVQPFTITQGLPSNSINKIVLDSRGFLWFCTGEGLSRFDGYEFSYFGPARGFPAGGVSDLVETRSGDYWAASTAGLVRLPAAERLKAEVILPAVDPRSRVVKALREDAGETLWVGTDGGLYRLPKGSSQLLPVETGPPPEPWSEPAVTKLEVDGAGNLWFGGFAGIGRIDPGGRVTRWSPRQGFPSYVVESLFRDSDGSIWAGTENGLCHLLVDPQPGGRPIDRCYGSEDGLPSPYIQSVTRRSDGSLWAGTLQGAAYAPAVPAHSPLRFTPVTTRLGLGDDDIQSLTEDLDGNLWLGSTQDGAMKLSRERIVLFTDADGLADLNAVAIFEDRASRLHVLTRSRSELVVNRFDGKRFVPIHPALPGSVTSLGAGEQQLVLQDRGGEWWLATGDGLLRYGPALDRRPRIYLTRQDSESRNVRRLFEDSQGNVWWSTSSRKGNTLLRWSIASGHVDDLTGAHGLPPLRQYLPSAFCEDRAGALWLGFRPEGLARHRGDGGFEFFGPSTGWPAGRVRSCYRDTHGRMWFGTSTGVWRLDDPRAASPAFQQYGVAQGLSSSLVHSLTGDDFGRIYVGTGIGLDRLDPAKGRIENFSATDGFPSSFVQASYRDRYGNIWLAGRHGVWRLTPTEGPVRGKPLRALVTSIKVRGIERPISSAGETELSGLTLASDQDQIELAFAAPQYHGSAKPLYQYRLEGSRSSEWSALSTIHSVHFASLAPGRYRFQVRAADARTREAAPPSTIEFRLLPPLWLTWWFQLGVVLLVAACIYALYRYRLRLMLEREQLRMSIATDLHDDIGSSLTRIAIWSEVAAQDAARAGTALPAPLAQVGTVSRELVDSMSDIVWAVNPRHDRFTDLASRMRRYVGNLESAASPRVTFEVQDQGWDIEAGAAVRREVFLIFKEALNNVLRHSGCANCRALLTLDAAGIILLVRDDGSGFEPETCPRGNGLDSMARRARRVGGILRIDACPGQGTSVELRIPGSARRRSTKPTWMGGAPSDGFR